MSVERLKAISLSRREARERSAMKCEWRVTREEWWMLQWMRVTVTDMCDGYGGFVVGGGEARNVSSPRWVSSCVTLMEKICSMVGRPYSRNICTNTKLRENPCPRYMVIPRTLWCMYNKMSQKQKLRAESSVVLFYGRIIICLKQLFSLYSGERDDVNWSVVKQAR